MDQITVQEYSLIEFCKKIEEVLNQGYKFDFENNSNVPINFGFHYYATLLKKEDEVVKVEPVKVDGRKKKEVV